MYGTPFIISGASVSGVPIIEFVNFFFVLQPKSPKWIFTLLSKKKFPNLISLWIVYFSWRYYIANKDYIHHFVIISSLIYDIFPL